MTIVFREQLSLMDREDCDFQACVVNASYQYSDTDGAKLKVCVTHDLTLRDEFSKPGDEVIDMTYQKEGA